MELCLNNLSEYYLYEYTSYFEELFRYYISFTEIKYCKIYIIYSFCHLSFGLLNDLLELHRILAFNKSLYFNIRPFCCQVLLNGTGYYLVITGNTKSGNIGSHSKLQDVNQALHMAANVIFAGFNRAVLNSELTKSRRFFFSAIYRFLVIINMDVYTKIPSLSILQVGL